MSLSPTRPLGTDRPFIQARMELNAQSGTAFLDEQCFNSLLDLERKRSRRSGRALILVLVNLTGLSGDTLLEAPERMDLTISPRVRETDLLGWYLRDAVIGILFTDIRSAGPRTREALFGKVLDALSFALSPDDLRQVYTTFHTFSADSSDAVPCGRFDTGGVGEHARKASRRRTPRESFSAGLYDLLGLKSYR